MAGLKRLGDLAGAEAGTLVQHGGDVVLCDLGLARRRQSRVRRLRFVEKLGAGAKETLPLERQWRHRL